MPGPPDHHSFIRYLEAKKSIDDRALNQAVWQHLTELLSELQSRKDLTILEVGCGIGTMVERMLDRRLFTRATYTAVDLQPELVAEARTRLRGYAAKQGLEVRDGAEGTLLLEGTDGRVAVRFVASDLFDLAGDERLDHSCDLIVAHAFLDLVDLDSALHNLLTFVRPGGLLYFTLNFDGATIFEPQVDSVLDQQIEALYHETMDIREAGRKASRMSRTGRRLLAFLARAGIPILSAGGSDWVVHPNFAGYSPDEIYFLRFIMETIRGALTGKFDLDQRLFGDWIAERHRQIESGELLYIAHQLDVLAQVPTSGRSLDQ